MTTPVPAPAPNPLLNILKTEPALFTALLGAAAALLAAFPVGVSQSQEAAIVTIGTAVITLFNAALARPVTVSLLTGAVATGLTAAAAFGLKLSPEVLAMITTSLGYFLPGFLLRLHLTPNTSLRAP
jgi:hypothetical protein